MLPVSENCYVKPENIFIINVSLYFVLYNSQTNQTINLWIHTSFNPLIADLIQNAYVNPWHSSYPGNA